MLRFLYCRKVEWIRSEKRILQISFQLLCDTRRRSDCAGLVMSSSMTTLQSSFQLSLTLLVRHVSVYNFDLEKSFLKALFNFPSRYLFNFYCHFLHVEVSDVYIHLKRLPSELFSTFPHDTWNSWIRESRQCNLSLTLMKEFLQSSFQLENLV